MNAAVSLALCVFGRLDWKMLPVYVVAQLLGSFLAAATIYTVYNGKDPSARRGTFKAFLNHFCLLLNYSRFKNFTDHIHIQDMQ